jgi:hypothetical protein
MLVSGLNIQLLPDERSPSLATVGVSKPALTTIRHGFSVVEVLDVDVVDVVVDVVELVDVVVVVVWVVDVVDDVEDVEDVLEVVVALQPKGCQTNHPSRTSKGHTWGGLPDTLSHCQYQVKSLCH